MLLWKWSFSSQLLPRRIIALINARGWCAGRNFFCAFWSTIWHTSPDFYCLRFMDSVDLSIDINYYIYLPDFSLKLFIWPPHNCQFWMCNLIHVCFVELWANETEMYPWRAPKRPNTCSVVINYWVRFTHISRRNDKVW